MQNILKSLALSALVFGLAYCKKAPAPVTAPLSAPTRASTSGAARPASALTTTATSGPVKLNFELMNALVPGPNRPAYFRASLTNVSQLPFEFKPDFFSDPRFQPSNAGIYLEAVEPGVAQATRIDYLSSHRAQEHSGYTDKQQSAIERLRNELDAAVSQNRKSGPDDGAAPQLASGDSIESATWVSPETGQPVVSGYAQLPFYLNTPGKHTVRLVFDFTSRQGPGAIRVATPWLSFEVSRP